MLDYFLDITEIARPLCALVFVEELQLRGRKIETFHSPRGGVEGVWRGS